jgi:hypothetical protein
VQRKYEISKAIRHHRLTGIPQGFKRAGVERPLEIDSL